MQEQQHDRRYAKRFHFYHRIHKHKQPHTATQPPSQPKTPSSSFAELFLNSRGLQALHYRLIPGTYGSDTPAHVHGKRRRMHPRLPNSMSTVSQVHIISICVHSAPLDTHRQGVGLQQPPTPRLLLRGTASKPMVPTRRYCRDCVLGHNSNLRRQGGATRTPHSTMNHGGSQ